MTEGEMLAHLYGTGMIAPEVIDAPVEAAMGAITGVKNFAGKVQDFTEKAGGMKQLITDVAANIGNAANSLLAEPTISGATGSTAGFKLAVRINAHFTQIVDTAPEFNGYPLCKVRKLSTLSGFCKVLNGDCEITGTKNESEALKAFLEGGIHIE